ncbi:fatty acid desaturase [Paraburkholderia sp. J67]|uniref:fatty acid desaturase n=1 Tax=Paraburkholderia sp. J67 TaxID=2805435 RepID=UPI002ABE45C3|nr:fatty acid desaturase [Paraburkholderia sp. J67]
MTLPVQPVPPTEPLPHRKILRGWLEPLARRTTLYPLLLLLLDYGLFVGLQALIVFVPNLIVKALCALVCGFVIGRLFIIGHDGCHQSLTPSRRLNKWLGRIAFLPSLTPYSLWEVGHNVVHHGYTNLKGFDFIWAPLTRAEYLALSRPRRLIERVYRSGWAPGLYYMVEIWWRRMFFPTRRAMPSRRPIFFRDCWLVTVFALGWLALLAWAAFATHQSVWLLLATGFVIPFLFWCSMIGFVVYVHHTHERVSWYEDRAAWTRAQPFVTTTVHLTFRWHFGALMHHIMEHTAHHLDMSIPLYRLEEAQAQLETLLPQRIVIQPFSWRWYFATAHYCKLYDFESACWTQFDGRKSAGD